MRQKNLWKQAQQVEPRPVAPPPAVHGNHASIAQPDARRLNPHLSSSHAPAPAAQAQLKQEIVPALVATQVSPKNERQTTLEPSDLPSNWFRLRNGDHSVPNVAGDAVRSAECCAAPTPVAPISSLQLRRRLTSDNGCVQHAGDEERSSLLGTTHLFGTAVDDVEKKVRAVEEQWGPLHPQAGKAHLLLYQACIQNSPNDPEVRRRAQMALTRRVLIFKMHFYMSNMKQAAFNS